MPVKFAAHDVSVDKLLPHDWYVFGTHATREVSSDRSRPGTTLMARTVTHVVPLDAASLPTENGCNQ